MMCAEYSVVISVYRSWVGIPVHVSLTVNIVHLLTFSIACTYTRVRTHLRETLVINSHTCMFRDTCTHVHTACSQWRI